jgi:hypothetical protein
MPPGREGLNLVCDLWHARGDVVDMFRPMQSQMFLFLRICPYNLYIGRERVSVQMPPERNVSVNGLLQNSTDTRSECLIVVHRLLVAVSRKW